MTGHDTGQNSDNNLVAAGAILAMLCTQTDVKVVTDAEGITNQLDITLSFMRSPYRITVERVATEDPP